MPSHPSSNPSWTSSSSSSSSNWRNNGHGNRNNNRNNSYSDDNRNNYHRNGNGNGNCNDHQHPYQQRQRSSHHSSSHYNDNYHASDNQQASASSSYYRRHNSNSNSNSNSNDRYGYGYNNGYNTGYNNNYNSNNYNSSGIRSNSNRNDNYHTARDSRDSHHTTTQQQQQPQYSNIGRRTWDNANRSRNSSNDSDYRNNSYTHSHTHSHYRNNRNTNTNTKTVCFFGDSFIRKFGLIKHPAIDVNPYKGATAKGLSRINNANRNQLYKTIVSNRPNAERLVFNFGNVDVHLSYYFCKYGDRSTTNGRSGNDTGSIVARNGNGDNGGDQTSANANANENDSDNANATKKEIDLVKIANDYVDFIASIVTSLSENNLSNGANDKSNTITSNDIKNSSSSSSSLKEVLILGVYPSAPEDEFFADSLVSYGSLTEEEAARIPMEDKTLIARRDRVRTFNNALQQRCKFHNTTTTTTTNIKKRSTDNDTDTDNSSGASGGTSNNKNSNSGSITIQYTDAIDEMTEQTTGRLREAYRDVSDHNIHVVWETTILLWMKRWPWYSRFAPKGFEEKLMKTLAEYIKTKPWAERKQIAETMGVNAAVEVEVDVDVDVDAMKTGEDS